jgi:hypothetical protein
MNLGKPSSLAIRLKLTEVYLGDHAIPVEPIFQQDILYQPL